MQRAVVTLCVVGAVSACQDNAARSAPPLATARRATARLRRAHHQRPRRRRHRRAVVRADVGIIGDRITAIGKLAGRDATTRIDAAEPGRRAGLHRHARPVGVQRPGRPARRQQDHAGHHHRDHRRGRVDRAAQRRARQVRAAAVRPVQGDARFPDARRVLRAARDAAARRSTSAPSSAPAACAPMWSARRSAPPRAAELDADEERSSRRRWSRARSASARRCSTCRVASPRTDEIVELAKVARQHGGIYISHQRSESSQIIPSLDEVFAVAERAGIPDGSVAPEDRLPGQLGPDAGGARALRGRARARPRRHGQHVSLRSRLERSRRLPAAVGARRRPRADAAAAEGSRAARSHQARHGRSQRQGLGEPVVRIGRRRRRDGVDRARSRAAQMGRQEARRRSARRWARIRAMRRWTS